MYKFYSTKAVSLSELEEAINKIISDRSVTDVKYSNIEKCDMGYIAYLIVDKVRMFQDVPDNKFKDTITMELETDDD